MDNKLNIQIVASDQCARLQSLMKTSFQQAFAKQNSAEDMQQYIEQHFSLQAINRQLEEPHSRFYWATIANQTVGYIKLNWQNAQTEVVDFDGLEIERVYLLQQFYGKGYGYQLLKFAESMAMQQQHQYLWLGVWEENSKAIGFYQHLGFEKFAEHHFLLGQAKQKDWLMRKIITT